MCFYLFSSLHLHQQYTTPSVGANRRIRPTWPSSHLHSSTPDLTSSPHSHSSHLRRLQVVTTSRLYSVTTQLLFSVYNLKILHLIRLQLPNPFIPPIPYPFSISLTQGRTLWPSQTSDSRSISGYSRYGWTNTKNNSCLWQSGLTNSSTRTYFKRSEGTKLLRCSFSFPFFLTKWNT